MSADMACSENMHGWHQHFSGKYPTIGALVEESQKDK